MLLPVLLSTLALVAGDVSHILNQEEHSPEPPPKPYAFTYTAGRYPGHADRQHTEVSDGSGVIRGQYSYIDPRQKIRTVQYVADKQGFHPILNDAPPDHPKDSEAVARAKDRHYNLYYKIAQAHQQHPYPDAPGAVRRTREIQPGAVVEAGAIVHPGATVEGGAVIKSGARVDDGAIVKGGAVVGPNAIVGRNAVVGAGAVMGAGAVLRPGSVLGAGQVMAPGEVRRNSSVPHQSAAVAQETAKHAQLFKVIAEQHARIAAEREALQREEEEKQHLQDLGHVQY